MKKIFFAVFAAVALLGMTACSKDDKSSSTIDKDALEKSLVGLWWDEFEYADVTETGEPFSRVLLAVDVAADHTGCIYLGVFDDVSDEAVAVYGGYEDTGFLWQLLDDGSLQLADPVTGETWARLPRPMPSRRRTSRRNSPACQALPARTSATTMTSTSTTRLRVSGGDSLRA